MTVVKHIDAAEKWVAKQFLDPAEYNIFLRDPISLRSEIKNRIFCEIRKLISTSGQTKPPFAPEKIAHYRKIKSVVGDETLRHREAILTPKDDGFIIKFNPTKPRVRVRFSLAHEIGHTYFFDLNTNPPQKFYSVMSSRYWVEEGYACEIAREILAPEPYVSAITTQICKYPSIHALIRLQKVFDISYDVLIKRLLYDSHLWNANFWENNLWNAIIMTANVSSLDDEMVNLKVYRSPTYRYKFKDIKDNKKLREIISHILKKYLFSWDNIPGNDNESLINFLKRKFGIDWVKTAEIKKRDDKTIEVTTTENNYLSLTMNDEETEVNLVTNDGTTDKFIVKREKDKLNIYLKNNAPIYDVISKRKNKYRVEGSLIERKRAMPMVILIAFKDDRRV